MKSLFFLGGASLLSGLEARRRFGVDRADAVLLATPRIIEAVSHRDWQHIGLLVTKSRGRNRALHAVETTLFLVDFVARHGPFEAIYIADLTTAMRVAALLASPARVIVVDDGLAAPARAAERQILPKDLLGKVFDPDTVTFFSAFGVTGRPRDDAVDNDYRCLRAELQRYPSSKEGWIIGQPLIDNGMMSQADYAAAIKAIAATIENPVYVRHPNETDAAASGGAGDLPMKGFRLPLEIEVLQGHPRPAVLTGFYSSALPQLAFVVPALTVRAVRLPSTMISRAHGPVALAYEALERVAATLPGFSVVPLPGSGPGSPAANVI